MNDILPPEIKELQRALRHIKAHELARHMTQLNRGANWGGSTKGDMLRSLSKDYLGHWRRVIQKHGSLAAWGDYMTRDITERREAAEREKQELKERREAKQDKLARLQDIGERLQRKKRVTADERKWYLKEAQYAIAFYRRTK